MHSFVGTARGSNTGPFDPKTNLSEQVRHSTTIPFPPPGRSQITEQVLILDIDNKRLTVSATQDQKIYCFPFKGTSILHYYLTLNLFCSNIPQITHCFLHFTTARAASKLSDSGTPRSRLCWLPLLVKCKDERERSLFTMSEQNKYIYKLDNGRLPERKNHNSWSPMIIEKSNHWH